MKFYTIEFNDKQYVAVEKGDKKLVTLEAMGIGVKDMNDEKRQDSNTSFMITTAEEAISELSQGMTLKAGTIIATGTPGGVAMGMKPPAFLKKGDIVRCEISGIGSLVNRVGI